MKSSQEEWERLPSPPSPTLISIMFNVLGAAMSATASDAKCNKSGWSLNPTSCQIRGLKNNHPSFYIASNPISNTVSEVLGLSASWEIWSSRYIPTYMPKVQHLDILQRASKVWPEMGGRFPFCIIHPPTACLPACGLACLTVSWLTTTKYSTALSQCSTESQCGILDRLLD